MVSLFPPNDKCTSNQILMNVLSTMWRKVLKLSLQCNLAINGVWIFRDTGNLPTRSNDPRLVGRGGSELRGASKCTCPCHRPTLHPDSQWQTAECDALMTHPGWLVMVMASVVQPGRCWSERLTGGWCQWLWCSVDPGCLVSVCHWGGLLCVCLRGQLS